MDDYEICDTIDDYLTEDCDLNDEFLFYRDYPNKGNHMIELVGDTDYETVVAHILRLYPVEIDQIYAYQQETKKAKKAQMAMPRKPSDYF